MKRAGNIDMDMIFSIISVVLIISFLQSTLTNINKINKKLDSATYKKELIRNESEKEKIKIGNFSDREDNLIKKEKYKKDNWIITKNRKIIESDYGYISTEIIFKNENDEERTIVFGVLGDKNYEVEKK